MRPGVATLMAAIAVVLGAILVGLVARRRLHLCWSFPVYVAAVALSNAAVIGWPEAFYRAPFYIWRDAVFNVLKLAIASELAFRTFRAFPGTHRRAGAGLSLVGAVTAIVVTGFPRSLDYAAIVTELAARLQTGIIWLFTYTALLVVWYRLPVHALHRAIALGFAGYLLVFTTLLNLLHQAGAVNFNSLRLYAESADVVAYLAMVGWWAFAAWRPAERLAAAPETIRALRLEAA